MHVTHSVRQRGVTLIEALIAFLVLALGMLAIARVQGEMRLHAEIGRERAEAVRLAQADIESLRGFVTLGAASGVPSFAAIASATRTVDASAGYATNAVYRLDRRIDAAGALSARHATVNIAWTDRRGGAQEAALHSVIAGIDPAFSGALGLRRSSAPAIGPFGRSVRIPFAAKDLGDGRSAFKPVAGGTVALVFDNLSGLIVGRCASVSAATPTAALSGAALGACDGQVGHLLSGVVRFSSASPPDAAHPNDAPQSLSIALALSGGVYPSAPVCSVEPVTSASSERFVAYHCVVYPAANGQWSGRATLVPAGWTIGTLAADQRVCRYSSDLDGSGAIDANLEHPSNWVGVDASLPNQDFLVIRGNETCPAAPAVQVAGNNSDVDVDLRTVQHQP